MPLPEIYACDLDPANAQGTPYILMGYISGKSYPHPFDQRGVITESDILKVHCQLVRISAELNSSCLDVIGQLRETNSFADDDEASCGPIVDRQDRTYGPFESSTDSFVERVRIV